MRVPPLQGPIDQEKAIQLNELLNLTPHLVLVFGWFDRRQKRHSICQMMTMRPTGEQLFSDHIGAHGYLG